jgi:predicted Ser/Thr protein kinase
MNRERFARIQELCDAARAMDDAGRRTAYLDEACGEDVELRAEVESLLVTRDVEDPFSEGRLEHAREALEDAVDRAAEHGGAGDLGTTSGWMPETIGPYRILRRLGEGGMGIVYEAEQDSPRRRVALKVMQPLLATDERARRFRHEAEVLGRLQHPGIAQIHEAGTFELGRGAQPYFAMELVEGVDLVTYVTRRDLDVRARLELLASVCDAVQHAHERGVIHRDLKPDNVFVDARGQVKVLDFGVARAAETSTMLSTLVTEEGQLLGTLAYMSPEQLSGVPDAVSPQSDVYALGALAFELCAGRLPHDVAGLPFSVAITVISQKDAQAGRGEQPYFAMELVDGVDLDIFANEKGQAELNERHAHIVELRLFGSLTIAETAAEIGVSPATVKSDWNLAKAWLARELVG